MDDLTIVTGDALTLPLEMAQTIRITSLDGPQVVDMWAINPLDTTEHLSTEHTRSCLEKLIPAIRDTLYSNRRRPILTLTEDTSGGAHDLLLSACDQARYDLLGHPDSHANCHDNFFRAIAPLNIGINKLPSPFNIFENVKITNGLLSIDSPIVKPGQYVTLRAEMQIHIVVSVCPMDLTLTNGPDRRSKKIRVTVDP
tara:strand:+ start:303 stop:896 length:594 start_codon:yes stop_codon:yes gene_type:complete